MNSSSTNEMQALGTFTDEVKPKTISKFPFSRVGDLEKSIATLSVRKLIRCARARPRLNLIGLFQGHLDVDKHHLTTTLPKERVVIFTFLQRYFFRGGQSTCWVVNEALIAFLRGKTSLRTPICSISIKSRLSLKIKLSKRFSGDKF